MNKRKISFNLAFALALSCASTATLAQYIPLTDLPDVPLPIDETGRIIISDPQGEVDPLSDPLNLNVIDNVDIYQLEETQRLTPYGQTIATPHKSIEAIPARRIDSSTSTSTVDDELEREGGWRGLARVLKALEPSVDTSLPETRTQLSNRINSLINSGQYQTALNEIHKVFTSSGYIESPGEDVQLRFLEARAYAASGQSQQALSSYKNLSSKYPELPEPYNNLAAMQMQLGLLDEAYESLTMATTLRPNYGIAQRNLGVVHLLKAEQSFDKAAKQRVRGAQQAAEAVRRIIQQGQ